MIYQLNIILFRKVDLTLSNCRGVRRVNESIIMIDKNSFSIYKNNNMSKSCLVIKIRFSSMPKKNTKIK